MALNHYKKTSAFMIIETDYKDKNLRIYLSWPNNLKNKSLIIFPTGFNKERKAKNSFIMALQFYKNKD